MKILHVCLSCFFIDGRSYQENELVRQHVQEGHEVLVVASTETHDPDGRLTYVLPSSYPGQEGAFVVRLPYVRGLPGPIARKLRIHPKFRDILDQFAPDAILFHGTCGWEIKTVAAYKRRHPATLLYVDSHEDTHNSGRSFLSMELLHRRYYGPLLRSALPDIDKILCVSTEAIDFVHNVYEVPRAALEFFPLGGRIPQDAEYQSRRLRMRSELGVADDEILVVQTGKQTRRKRLLEALSAFSNAASSNMKFAIAGVVDPDISSQAKIQIDADKRIQFLGWKDSEGLTDLLCAADIYIQPGTQSVTMQHSLCCRCIVVLDETPAHLPYIRGNGWLISPTSTLEDIFHKLSYADLASMSDKSYKLACEILDYKTLATRVLA